MLRGLQDLLISHYPIITSGGGGGGGGVYRNNPQNFVALKTNIRNEVMSILTETLKMLCQVYLPEWLLV